MSSDVAKNYELRFPTPALGAKIPHTFLPLPFRLRRLRMGTLSANFKMRFS